MLADTDTDTDTDADADAGPDPDLGTEAEDVDVDFGSGAGGAAVAGAPDACSTPVRDEPVDPGREAASRTDADPAADMAGALASPVSAVHDPGVTGPDAGGPAVGGPAAGGPAVDEPAAGGSAADRRPTDPAAAGARSPSVPPGEGSDSSSGCGLPGSADVSGAWSRSEARPGPLPEECARYGVEIRVGLGTLLGCDDHPGELAGWGPIDAEQSRELVAGQHGAEWRFAVLDDNGYLVLGGLMRLRPTVKGSSGRRCRGGVVEIHVRAALLAELVLRADLPPPWIPLVVDINRRCGERESVLHRLDGDPLARFPGSGLRRHVQMRDRSCMAPGCRRPARKADQDHTEQYRRGGQTVSANLDPLCPRHHLMKHEWGWTLTQVRPGLFRWRSPLGKIYWTRGDPIAADLPDPIPGPPADRDSDTLPETTPPGTTPPGYMPPPNDEVPPPPIFDTHCRRGRRSPPEQPPAPIHRPALTVPPSAMTINTPLMTRSRPSEILPPTGVTSTSGARRFEIAIRPPRCRTRQKRSPTFRIPGRGRVAVPLSG